MKDTVISPYELIKAEGSKWYRVNSQYYITKHLIPVLNRVCDKTFFQRKMTQLFHIDTEKWYRSMQNVPSPPSFAIPHTRQIPSHHWPQRCSHFPFEIKEPLPTEETVLRGKGIDSFYVSNSCFFCGSICAGSEQVCPHCQQFDI